MPEFESRFLWCPSRSLVTVPPTLSWFPVVDLNGDNKRVHPMKYEVLFYVFIVITTFSQ